MSVNVKFIAFIFTGLQVKHAPLQNLAKKNAPGMGLKGGEHTWICIHIYYIYTQYLPTYIYFDVIDLHI